MTDDHNLDIDELINNLDQDFSKTHRQDSTAIKHQKETDLQRLISHWLTERTCPDILPYEQELIDTMIERIRQQVEVIEITTEEQQTKQDQASASQSKLKLLIIESELERVKFLIRGYLRTRIQKIDQYYIYILEHPDIMAKLGQTERTYVTRRSENLKRYYGEKFLSGLPESLQLLNDTQGPVSMIDEPELDNFVFIRVVKSDPRLVQVDKEETITLEKGNIYVLPYRLIQRQASQKIVQLI
ncbi:uncharacterized protein V1516DRAFT_672968 [Lipomyces oligophaga]|uniref:uncharacterized protein n=1 Tax=Lipomyces oligophaga TaxID=45792 RepID=UPI0034CD9F99